MSLRLPDLLHHRREVTALTSNAPSCPPPPVIICRGENLAFLGEQASHLPLYSPRTTCVSGTQWDSALAERHLSSLLAP